MQEKLYRIKPGYMIENIAGKYVLMAPAVGDIDYSKMLVLSESAVFIVNKLMEGNDNFFSLLDALLAEYNVKEKQAREELTAFLLKLEGLNVFEN